MSQQSPIKGTGSDPMRFFQIILQNMRNKPDVDWNIVAAKAGYNSANTAKVRYGQIMRKLNAQNGVPASPSISTTTSFNTNTGASFSQPTSSLATSNNGGSFNDVAGGTGSFSSPPATPTHPKPRKQVGSGSNKSPMKVGKASQKRGATGGSFDRDVFVKREEWEERRIGAGEGSFGEAIET